MEEIGWGVEMLPLGVSKGGVNVAWVKREYECKAKGLGGIMFKDSQWMNSYLLGK